jgi:transposase
LVFPNAAAIDVGASSHWAAVPPHSTDAPVREVGAMTDDLNALADWLLACGVDVVALESTGVYWIPVYEVLEQRGLKVWLVDARQVKYVPGRKSDVQDCQWLQKLMSYGLLRAAFRPAAEVCVLRAVARQREVLLTSQASWVQRMQKALVQMNIQLTEVISDVMGQTGQAIIRDIVAGQREPKLLAKHRHRRIKASEQDIVRALTGNWREEHLFVLKQALAMYDDIAKHLAECEAKLQALLAERSVASVELGKAPRAGSKARAEFDVRQQLANWAGADLTRINGLGLDSVMKILSEIGTDLSRFANVKHFCSWLGLCPATKISGGKVLSARLRAGGVLPAPVRPNGQASRQHRHRPQVGANGVLHAHPRRGLRRRGAAALRRPAARTQHRRAQASRRSAGLPHQPCGSSRMTTAAFSSVS